MREDAKGPPCPELKSEQGKHKGPRLCLFAPLHSLILGEIPYILPRWTLNRPPLRAVPGHRPGGVASAAQPDDGRSRGARRGSSRCGVSGPGHRPGKHSKPGASSAAPALAANTPYSPGLGRSLHCQAGCWLVRGTTTLLALPSQPHLHCRLTKHPQTWFLLKFAILSIPKPFSHQSLRS